MPSLHVPGLGFWREPRKAVLPCLLALGCLLPGPAQAQVPNAGSGESNWPYALPLWGEKLAERGIAFPLPVGFGINYAYINQPITIDRVVVGVNDSEMVDISDLITFDSVESKVHAVNARVDVWLLPFLNLYALGNYAIESQTSVSIAEPFSFDAGATQPGLGGGFGTTLAGGAFGFFGTLDLNWTWNKMEKLDAPVGTFLLTPRIGRNFGKVGPVDLIFWVGAMRQKIQSKTEGQIRLSDTIDDAGDGSFNDKLEDWYEGLPPSRQAIVRGLAGRLEDAEDPIIRYDLNKAVAHPWNMTLGTEIGFTPAWRLRAEVGFINRTQVIVGINYRFGGFFRSETDVEEDE